MKTVQIIIYAFFLVFFSCNKPQNGDSAQSGDPVDEPEVVLVDQVLENPESYIGKKVKVEGMVSHVCRHSGKRLHLTSKSSSKMIRVEAADGINQFERELEGNDIVVEGIFNRQVIDEDYLARWENEGLEGEGVHLEHGSEEAAAKEEQISNYRQRLRESGNDQLVSLWIDGNAFEVK